MNKSLDVRSIQLPPQFVLALNFLISRVVNAGKSTATERMRYSSDEMIATYMIEQLFGDAPLFGALQDVKSDEIRAAFGTVVPPTAYVREIADCISRITPWTPVCESCGEFPLASSGGKVSELSVGALCPFCKNGTVELVAILLRRINWVTGELVDPMLEEDYRTQPGVRIPLTDESIAQWVSNIDPLLRSRMERVSDRIPFCVFHLLAYMHLRRQVFSSPEDAATFLRDPSLFGLTGDHLTEEVKSAQRFVDEREVWNVPQRYLSDGQLRQDCWPLTVGDRTYLIEGLVGRGDKCDVFRGRWDHNPTERVIVKVLVAESDSDLLAREVTTLAKIRRSDDVDSEFFRRFVPSLMESGYGLFPDGRKRAVIVTHESHQFDWTLEDVRREYPNGIHPRTMVWMMNRLTELLAWVHRKRIVHGAVFPAHVLIQPLTHRIMLIDWSYAQNIGRQRSAWSKLNERFYPATMIDTELAPAHDLAMACRCMLHVLGIDLTGSFDTRVICPEGKDVGPLTDILYAHAMYSDSMPNVSDAKEFKEKFGKVAREIYGLPVYHPFEMPAR